MSAICSHTDGIELTAEPGENWSWCYVDNVAFVVTGR
jgi:hypothetical protein